MNALDLTRTQDFRPFELVAERLGPLTPNGAGWLGHCPAHDDRRPSLKVDESEDGTLLLFCHAGCSTHEVMGALGLELRHLFPRDSGSRTRSEVEPVTPTYSTLSWGAQARLHRAQMALLQDRKTLLALREQKSIRAWVVQSAALGWDADRRELLIPYTLGDGRTLAALDRWRFRGDRDASGRPSKAAYGHPRPLYVPRAVLAELVTSTLLVTEGPLDALSACSHGNAAVAAPSASTWKSDYAAGVSDLDPTRVIVCGDCDDAGRRFADRAAADLAAHGLDVAVLDLDPERHDGHDVGAHLLEGGRLP